MAKIAGISYVKSPTGRVTHVKLSLKHHKNLLEDLILSAQIEKGKKDTFLPWEDVRSKLLKTKVQKNGRI